ncbi:TetR/AcrR family transcriptional regulator [Ruania zhangjianzhongii]|uniref:TetR/AcrR family transcriptional regulator n=1 Tax=Ruania zhangjianzhongii TaxID=2603206 RepID=UPI0011C74EF5|nr:TetR/AcrR family transcriptional regulator [Ruania zhangjianzhongii]
MATEFSTAADTGGTFIERARRAQLIEVTIELVADDGYRGASLARIAERAGLSKAAVLYHFASKDALVQAAHQATLVALTGDVAKAIEAADSADAPAAYVRAMIGHLREQPRHTRMLIEAMSHGFGEHGAAERWRALAQILEASWPGRLADSRTAAVIIGGAIDGIVNESLQDPTYDTAAAAEQLIRMIAVAT